MSIKKLWDSVKWWDNEEIGLGDTGDSSEFLSNMLTKPKVRRYNHSAKLRELQQLYDSTVDVHKESVFSQLDGYKLAQVITKEAIDRSKKRASLGLIEPFFDAVLDLAQEEAFFGITEMDWNRDIPLSEQIETKQFLNEKQNIYQQGEPYLELWVETVIESFVTVLQSMPSIQTSETDEAFSVSVIHLLDKPNHVVEQVLLCFFHPQVLENNVFEALRKRLDFNGMIASGIDPDEKQTTHKKLIYPTESRFEGTELSSAYLRGTVFNSIFKSPYPIEIPESIRMEHTHILAGTGYGKTQLIQKLILDDLRAGRGFCVIDSQGDLIRNISMLAEFDPQVSDSLADKFIIIDPTDIDYPACLNMFAMTKGLDESSSFQKELILNATIDLYSYIFGALFGAELTTKQGTVFAYIARLMTEIPDANIQTLRELMEDGRQFIPYMEKLEGSARAFFKTQFFTTTFGQSKKQVLSRLWAVLSNATLERLFSNLENKVNVYDVINEGKVLLVNTSKDLLQKDGSAVLGRFFIALLSQATIKRSNLPESERTPYMIYIDEAHEYFDHRFEDILNQARKYKVGFTLSHQNLGQLHELRSTVASSTSVKLAGGISSNDAQLMAREMRSSTDEILAVRKGSGQAEFAAYLKNITPGILPLTVKFGLLEKKPFMSQQSFQLLMERNRKRYCNHISQIYLGQEEEGGWQFGKVATTKPAPKNLKEKEVPQKKEIQEKSIESTKPSKPKTVKVETEGKGGLQHKWLQNMVKKISNERGFKAILEKQVLSGAGQIDVAIEGYDKVLAVEISVSTDWKWEASNITKCLSTGADQVIILSSDQKHLQTLKTNLSEEFSNNEKLSFFTPENLISHLDEIRASASNKEKTVRGYKVKVKYASTSKDEAQAKKDAIAKVLVGAMR